MRLETSEHLVAGRDTVEELLVLQITQREVQQVGDFALSNLPCLFCIGRMVGFFQQIFVLNGLIRKEMINFELERLRRRNRLTLCFQSSRRDSIQSQIDKPRSYSIIALK